MPIASVSDLDESRRIEIADAYADGTVWFSIRDSENRLALICIDGRQDSPTRHRLFDLARHPRKSSAVLLELGSPEEGIVVPLISWWLDSADPKRLGLTEFGWELIRDALLALGAQD